DLSEAVSPGHVEQHARVTTDIQHAIATGQVRADELVVELERPFDIPLLSRAHVGMGSIGVQGAYPSLVEDRARVPKAAAGAFPDPIVHALGIVHGPGRRRLR